MFIAVGNECVFDHEDPEVWSQWIVRHNQKCSSDTLDHNMLRIERNETGSRSPLPLCREADEETDDYDNSFNSTCGNGGERPERKSVGAIESNNLLKNRQNVHFDESIKVTDDILRRNYFYGASKEKIKTGDDDRFSDGDGVGSEDDDDLNHDANQAKKERVNVNQKHKHKLRSKQKNKQKTHHEDDKLAQSGLHPEFEGMKKDYINDTIRAGLVVQAPLAMFLICSYMSNTELFTFMAASKSMKSLLLQNHELRDRRRAALSSENAAREAAKKKREEKRKRSKRAAIGSDKKDDKKDAFARGGRTGR